MENHPHAVPPSECAGSGWGERPREPLSLGRGAVLLRPNSSHVDGRSKTAPRRSLRRWTLALLLAIATGSAVRPVAAAGSPALAAPDEVFYQIFFRSFCDSNGDRIGDLRGLESKLDYLTDLGVTSLMLTPLPPSPFYHNYFAANFEGIDPAYGTMEDFRALVRAVHARGMQLYLDQEIQYVTYDHLWLKSSLGQPDAEYSRHVLYQDPGHTQPESAFYGLSAYPTYDGRTIQVTTVNLPEPAVIASFQKLFVFWIDPHGDGSLRDGVDGFRIDHMMDDLDGKAQLKGLFARFWQPVFSAVRARNPRAKIIAEQADWGYGDDWLTRGGVDMVFAFPIRNAIVKLDKAALLQAIRETEARTPAGKVQLTLIENHDLNRFASEAGGDLAKQKIGAALDVLLRGIPLLYYGQELGMRGRQSQVWGTDANDIPVREAFRWTRDLEAPGSAIWYRDAKSPWWTGRYSRSGDGVSVEEESRDPASLLAFYRQLLRIRAARPEIQHGQQTLLAESAPNVVCFLRHQGSSRTLVAINLSAAPATVAFSPKETAAGQLTDAWVDLLHEQKPAHVSELKLAPFDVRVLVSP